jgi:hypothetical protein
MRTLSVLIGTAIILGSVLPAQAATISQQRIQVSRVAAKLQDGSDGFGGIIIGITPCICTDLGFLLTIVGANSGDYLFSFSNPPKLKVGPIFVTPSPVIGAAKGDGRCGTKISRGGCINIKAGKVITQIGTPIQF